MTNREKLHAFVDGLSENEAQATLRRLQAEREAVRQWAGADESGTEDAWALANAREGVREEPW